MLNKATTNDLAHDYGKLSERVGAYVEALKPRETILLTLIAMLAGFTAGEGSMPFELSVILLAAILLGSAGCNGLTNYLDREFDARSERTMHRPLPSGRIAPPEKLLAVVLPAIIIALLLAWLLKPLAFWVGLAGVIAAVVARKSSLTHYLGIISSIAPIAVAWIIVTGGVDATLLAIAMVIAIWVPVHVWSVMLAYSEDYRQSGPLIFPLTVERQTAAKLLALTAVLLAGAAIFLGFAGGFGFIYLAGTAGLGVWILTASLRLAKQPDSAASFRLYRISTYPYLGLVFALMLLDKVFEAWLP